jgi:hypothetical protein
MARLDDLPGGVLKKLARDVSEGVVGAVDANVTVL